MWDNDWRKNHGRLELISQHLVRKWRKMSKCHQSLKCAHRCNFTYQPCFSISFLLICTENTLTRPVCIPRGMDIHHMMNHSFGVPKYLLTIPPAALNILSNKTVSNTTKILATFPAVHFLRDKSSYVSWILCVTPNQRYNHPKSRVWWCSMFLVNSAFVLFGYDGNYGQKSRGHNYSPWQRIPRGWRWNAVTKAYIFSSLILAGMAAQHAPFILSKRPGITTKGLGLGLLMNLRNSREHWLSLM